MVFILDSVIEMFATSSGLIANACLLYKIHMNPEGKVPKLVVSFQICANLCWMMHAVLTNDGYLFTTSLTSCCMQIFSFLILQKKQPVKHSISETRLPIIEKNQLRS